MGALLQFAFEFERLICCNCGIPFAMATAFATKRRRDHENFYCPAGHPQHWPGESDVERLQREVASEKQRREWAERNAEQARTARDHAERSARTYKGKVTAIKNRVGNGVCPCCTRSFTNLRRHMATKHPTYKSEEAGS